MLFSGLSPSWGILQATFTISTVSCCKKRFYSKLYNGLHKYNHISCYAEDVMNSTWINIQMSKKPARCWRIVGLMSVNAHLQSVKLHQTLQWPSTNVHSSLSSVDITGSSHHCLGNIWWFLKKCYTTILFYLLTSF